MRGTRLLFLLLGLLLPLSAAFGQTGKIAGRVTDAQTGESLPSVNVAIEGTTQGAITDEEGYYTILNVRPGTYAVRASFIGYTQQTITDVRVNIDLTAEVDFQLQEETVGLDEVMVVAERPIVQRDVSANVANFNAEEIENMPVAGVSEVIDLQAGIEPGMRVRGGTLDELGFYVDGMATPAGRNQQPFTNISFTAISEVQVQTGGFNAEYGDLRSGLINIVTKDGPRDRYTADAMIRYSSPSRKYFGDPDDPMSYSNRQWLDMGDVTGDGVPDSLAFYGIKNVLDRWDWRNYANSFEGYRAQIEKNQTNDDPEDDHLTAEDLMAIYKYRTRRSAKVEAPDYDVDVTVGGPVPAISEALGNLRFLGSFRQQQEAYALPAERDAFTGRTGQFKVTSDLRQGMKLTVNGLLAKEMGTNPDGEGNPTLLRGRNPVYPWQGDNWYFANQMDVGDYKAFGNLLLMDIDRNMVGAELTHTISPTTFYEVRLQRTATEYFTRPGVMLNKDEIVAYVYNGRVFDDPNEPGWAEAKANGYGLDAGPLGFDEEHGINTPIGDVWRRGWEGGRDTSNYVAWNGSFDITSQLNRFMQVKTGLSYQLDDYDINHGRWDPFHPHHENPKFKWNRQPSKGAAYGQTKLEFKGMVANLGLRLDYFHAGGEWYDYSPHDLRLATEGREGLEEFETEPTERQLTASPRLGVSFPITDNSKLFFNYGHMRQTLDPRWLYQVRVTDRGEIRELGNPSHPMPKTVQYEMGYEQNLFDQFLLRLGGYYKDVSNEERSVGFTSADEQVFLRVRYPFNYEDVRGFEATITKNRGRFIRGFVNYTYLVRKEGDFGYPFRFENEVVQRSREEQHRNGQWRPVPEPFARFDIEFILPEDFGPAVAGTNPFGDWRLSFLGDWRSGQRFTWVGGQGASVEGIRDNMKWRNYYNLDMRLSKAFATRIGHAQFFIDVSNVLNIRRLQYNAYGGDFNQDRYFRSLHLPQEFFHDRTGELSPDAPTDILWGGDRPGDFRDGDVEFVPIVVGSLPETGEVRTGNRFGPLYAVRDDAGNVSWFVWNPNTNAFDTADQSKVRQVLDDKAYIDMPAVEWRRFLNPRNVFFGLRLTF